MNSFLTGIVAVVVPVAMGTPASHADSPVGLARDVARIFQEHCIRCHSEVRMPMFQAGTYGRDHNPFGFTCWLAGAGVKPGISYGATDAFGFRAVEDVTTPHDLHATILHLLGLNHEQLTFYHNGIQRRLTDVHGRVVTGILS